NGVTIAYGYDSGDRVTSIVAKDPASAILKSLAYVYAKGATNTDLIQTRTDEAKNVTSYTYDALNRLTEAKTVAGDGTTVVSDYTYSYDGAGNRTSQTVVAGGTSSTTPYVYNGANEMTSAGATTYSYDA